jgi:hypothetical protein
LDSVITDVMGMSGRAKIEALIAGESNPAKLANLANYRLKVSQEKLMARSARSSSAGRTPCTRCARKGRYNVAKPVAQYGRSGNMSKWGPSIARAMQSDLPRSSEGAVN